ncbi:MAG: ABC transporter substrate-binding protein, partial [Salinirussus sp.]
KWFFHAFGNADQTSRAIGNFLLPRDGWESVFLVFEDYAWGQSWKAGIEGRFEEHGTRLAGTGPASYGTSDYSSQISQAINSDADAVIGAVVSATNFLKQATQLGLREEKNLALGFFVLPYGKGVSQSELAGAWAPSKYYFLLQNDNNRNFVERYYNKYERLPTAASASSYKSMMELLKSYESEGNNPESITSYMEGREFTYFKGEPEYYRECDHQLVQPIGVGRGYQERPDFSQFGMDVPDPTEYSLFETVGKAGGKSNPGLPACKDLAGSMD